MKEKIKGHLNSNSYKLLVILDDVWKAEDALPYVEVFCSCKILLTTRKSVINSKIPTNNPIDIKPMELDEAVKLLTSRIDAFKTLDDSARGNDIQTSRIFVLLATSSESCPYPAIHLLY